ncbi:hypothetical protein IRZ71_01045 [Flavobacterium sp. ANB]|uniref:hypothetical protein n=1 Tax=unclassified Flavobacterium TaxID=196869 RepID=UPI0012BA020F|nr:MULTISPECIES: hypothetical protein [unclassified Flavobacterium]MBF4514909.1 hypothetical protein [Flavobacterium sp. ANB]MTD68235.1 hypothetical protein [Flavobacterium sp. LC2016-13]
MKNYQKKSAFLILFGLFINIYSIHSQTNNDVALYNWFDKAVGKENLELYNGPRHINFYRTFDKSHSYYISEDYSNGNLNYQGQNYYNLNLKYDVNNDLLVLKSVGEYEYLGINLIKEKTAYFTLQNKKFINIEINNPEHPAYMTGYYQEIVFSKNNTLYIKHHKRREKVIDAQKISDGSNANSSDRFKEKNEFILKYKNEYYKIGSKSDVIKIFPEYKGQIKKYYNNNSQLEESDNKLFIENLIKEINNLLPNASN